VSGERAIPTYPDLAGRVALVTGGSKGIGAATCRVLAANRVNVAVVARSQPGIDSVVAELREAGTEAIGISGDVGEMIEIERMHERVRSELGPIDILLPFAGGFGEFTPVEEISVEEWREVIEANLTATFLTVSAIVTMSSNGGRYLDKLLTASYAAAKAGVIQFTRHVAKELGQYGIRANVIAPATVSSARIERIMDEPSRARVAEMSPLGTMGTPLDCALATLFLVSDSARWLTGVTLDIAGGRIML
jgi:3-oxoacyl-[acyl-carrier protein] reductase